MTQKKNKKPTTKSTASFRSGDYVVYPTHGVGQVKGTEVQEVAGHKMKLVVIKFEHARMTLRVPTTKVEDSGLRPVLTKPKMDEALKKLKGKPKVRKVMWSRRAQEYEAKINSGDPSTIAEVVRDLHKNTLQPDQSYSERQIYNAALERLAREVAAVNKTDLDVASEKLKSMVQVA